MRLKVQHATIVTYSEPAQSAIQILRLTPRNHDGQYVGFWRVEIDADYRLTRDEDPFGNITHTFSLEGPIETMTIRVEGEVEVNDTNGVILGTVERMTKRFWLRDSLLTAPDAAIRMFSKRIAAGEGGEAIAYLHALNAAVNTTIKLHKGPVSLSNPVTHAFSQKRGTSQDLAQIFVSACRAVKIPSRYVSGYYLREDGDQTDAGHAWAEAYVEGLGWLGFDPEHDCCTSDRHIRVAHGTDAADAAPVRGARFGGQAGEVQEEVHVSSRRQLVEE